MPNHFHGIIIIGENDFNDGTNHDDTGREAMHRVPTDSNNVGNKNQFGAQSKNPASVTRGYKSSVTTWARKNHCEFDWQARFHDHIIRNYEEFEGISRYIKTNVSMWMDDRFYNP